MAFRSLIDRYENNVRDLYSPPPYAAPEMGQTRYENLREKYEATQDWLYDTNKVNFDPNDVEYNWTKLKRGEVGRNTNLLKAESRSIPILSALEDAKRITKFQFSRKGLLFLAQQALLQTGNTFVSTRVLNPAFLIGNTIPFARMNRNISPITLGGIKIDISRNKELAGKLQQETIDILGPKLSDLVGQGSLKNTAIRTVTSIFGRGFFKKIVSPFNSVKKALSIGRANSDEFGLLNLYRSSNFPILFAKDDSGIPRYIGKEDGLSNLYDNLNSPLTTGYGNMFFGGLRTVIKPEVNGDSQQYDLANLSGPSDRLNLDIEEVPYISRRPAGSARRNPKQPNLYLDEVYSALSSPTDEDDYIITRIKVGKFNMQFRSFISNIQESVNTEMSERNYIGRTERYLAYANTKREVSFTLQLIAMSEDELIATHTRLNYLIGSLFPQNAVQGLLQPPIVYLTVGDLFINQPGYFRNLNITYPYSWEVRNTGRRDGSLQLPHGADVNCSFMVLEKGTVFHQSPFHSIMERY